MLNPQISLSPVALPLDQEFNVFAEVNLDPDFAGRPPSFWVLVLDDSGSMGRPAKGGRPKVEVVKDGVSQIFRQFQENDLVFVVGFSDSQRVLLSKREILQGTDPKRLVNEIVAYLFASGTTVMSGALAEVLAVVPVHVHEYAVRVLLITDGRVLEHLEYSEPHRVDHEKAKCFQAANELGDSNISLWIGGIGTDYDDHFLSEMANRSQSSYFHISDAQDLENIFRDVAISLTSVAVTNLTVEVLPSPKVQLGRIWKTVPQVAQLDSLTGTRSLLFNLDQLEKVRGQKVLMQFFAPSVSRTGDFDLASVQFRYDVPVLGKKGVVEEVVLKIPVTMDANAGQLDKRVMTTVAAAQTLLMATAGALSQDLSTLSTAQANLQQLLTTAKTHLDAATIASLQDVSQQTARVTSRLTTQRGPTSAQTTDELRKLQTMAKTGLSGKLTKKRGRNK